MSLEEERGADLLLRAASLVIVIAGMRAAGALLVPFLVAMFLSILGVPLVGWLRTALRLPTVLAVLLVVLLLLGIPVAIGAVVSGSLQQFTALLPRYQQDFHAWALTLDDWFHRWGFELSVSDFLGVINIDAAFQLAGATLIGLATALSNFFLVILTVIFILMEAAGFSEKLRSALQNPAADLSRFTRITTEVQNYLLMKTLVSLITGLLLGLWVAALGIDFPVLWGSMAFLLNYIPNLGSIISAIPPVTLALLHIGPERALLVAAGYLAVNLILGNLVEPYLMGRKLGLSTLVVFLSLVFWGWLWGPMGMILSVPLTMVVKILLEHSDRYRWAAMLLGPSPQPPPKPPPVED